MYIATPLYTFMTRCTGTASIPDSVSYNTRRINMICETCRACLLLTLKLRTSIILGGGGGGVLNPCGANTKSLFVRPSVHPSVCIGVDIH